MFTVFFLYCFACLMGVELFVSGCYSILECYNLSSGVKLSIRLSCLFCWNSQCLLDSSYIILLVSMGVKLLLCLAITLSWTAITWFLESS